MANISYNLGRVFVILSPDEAEQWAESLDHTLPEEAERLRAESSILKGEKLSSA